ncbi:hypothetical protein C2G38_2252228 [Gigaspora rosea]|uniref:Uncharacterized protein n=1 Tax=Gigaspora rosea TaxID=44941 RepID=A0A397UEM6_9GLOM|nr:hypothetical protein C2G38_2252228 [Gigaspora rosea]
MSNNSNNPSKTSNTKTTYADISTYITNPPINSDNIANPPTLDDNNYNNYFDYDSSDSIESIASVYSIFSRMKNNQQQPSQTRQPSQFRQPSQSNRFLSPQHEIRGRSCVRSNNQNQTRRQNDRSRGSQLNAGASPRCKRNQRRIKAAKKRKGNDLSPQVLDLMTKMKNYWGAAFQNISNSIWKVFGVEKLSLLKSNAGVSEIVRWKQSVEVADCFRLLFVQNESGAYWIDLIARNAFSTAACQMYGERMKRRVEKFLNDYNSGGPSYFSAEAIMDEELEANEHRS